MTRHESEQTMKCDVAEYIDTDGYDDPKLLYAITENNISIGLTLPEECESVEMGMAFCQWLDGEHEGIILTWTSPNQIKELFAAFLKQRKSAEEEYTSCKNCDSPLYNEESIKFGYCQRCRREDHLKQEQQSEDSGEGESEYQFVRCANWERGYGFSPAVGEWYIQHIKSKAMVSMRFGLKGDVEGFLKWWRRRDAFIGIHTYQLSVLEKYFDEYKAETAEQEVKQTEAQCEKQIRIKYQNIVYKVCGIIDDHNGNSVIDGSGVVVSEVEPELKKLLKRLNRTEKSE